MLGPDFDAKDMEDIFKGIVDNNDKNKVRKFYGTYYAKLYDGEGGGR